jgi:hypothetical protein
MPEVRRWDPARDHGDLPAVPAASSEVRHEGKFRKHVPSRGREKGEDQGVLEVPKAFFFRLLIWNPVKMLAMPVMMK